MSFAVSGVNNNSKVYEAPKAVENTGTKEASSKAAEVGATYEKSAETGKSGIYTINKMSAEDRANLVSQLKADQANRVSQLTSIVQDMMTKQAGAYGKAEDMWKFLASGKFTVDAATKAQAEADIAEDGYYGVKQTSQRLFDFASALAGDDVEKMKKMQEAMQKGFDMATKTWGKELPQICQDTIAAANKMFDDYYASKQ